ncbi:MAG: nicotinate (nicotinamide) nucleotide adenylyltransferase [Spirochaetaceae bacterium]|nr:MAG: nicotinate (nicotinamide) nucleotide adenylyltransferase [Spirochaetaceae bacterium]
MAAAGPMMSKQRVALLGGTFDPVHVGHLFVAEEVHRLFGYQRILFVPAAQPPHKQRQPCADAQQRLEMLQLAVAGNHAFAVESWELHQGGVSYTVDTVRHLSGRCDGRLGLIIGDDLVEGFDRWHLAQELIRRTDIMVARRDDRPLPGLLSAATALDNSPLAVSSSMIRERIGRGAAFRYLVPESVYDYIQRHGLYRMHAVR